MKTIITSLGLFLIGIMAHAQEKRTVSSFSKIEVSGNIEMVYTETLAPSIKVSPENDANIITEINKGLLKISLKNASTQTMKVYVTGKKLQSIKATGAKVTVKNMLPVADFELALLSGATFNGHIKSGQKVTLRADDHAAFVGRIDAGNLSARLTSDAKMALSGSADVARISTDGRAKCLAGNFSAVKMWVQAAGFSSAKVYAGQSIDIAVSEKAQVAYTGTPADVHMNENAIAYDGRIAAQPIASK